MWRCWFMHNWEKWSKATVVGVTDGGGQATVQDRHCIRCNKYQRRVRPDRIG